MKRKLETYDFDKLDVTSQVSSPYIYVEKKKINGIDTEITTSSYYPIPWSSFAERPSDYYEKQSKTITYYKDDVDENNNPTLKKIVIEIPRVNEGENLHRTITVKVDGNPMIFRDNSALDMKQTFNIRDVNLLMNAISNNFNPHGNASLLQEITPFIHLPEAHERNQKEYEFNKKNNGNIQKILSPYIQKMCSLSHTNTVKQLLIPVATKGGPHHWNLCLLSIDKDNAPSLYYVESESILGSFDYHTFLYYMEDYKRRILPEINKLLTKFHYPEIDTINYCQAKQFSQEGCGFAMSINIQKILEGIYPQVLCNSNSEKKQIPSPIEARNLSSRVSIEEDAIMRVELAFKIQARTSIITERNIDKELAEMKSFVCSEILSDSRTLNTRAREAFGFFQPSNPTFSTDHPADTNDEMGDNDNGALCNLE